MINMGRVWDIEELALRAMGKTCEEKDEFINDGGDINDELMNAYGIGIDAYVKIIEDLFPFVPPIEGGEALAWTGQKDDSLYHAFIDPKAMTAIVKKRADIVLGSIVNKKADHESVTFKR